MQPLDRDLAVELLVVGTPDLGAPAEGEALDEPVSAQDQLIVHRPTSRGTGPAPPP